MKKSVFFFKEYLRHKIKKINLFNLQKPIQIKNKNYNFVLKKKKKEINNAIYKDIKT